MEEVVHTFSNLFISDLLGDVLKLMIYFSTAIALLYGRGYLPTGRSTSPVLPARAADDARHDGDGRPATCCRCTSASMMSLALL